jgi:hypothetical protein
MALVSSVVTELTPLILALQRPIQPSFLVIEEPEAHLHPRVQRILARVLVRLANRGGKLLISTHSDLFAQQVNNCLKLGAAKQKLKPDAFAALVKKLGVHEEEALAVDAVAGYGFTRQHDGSTQVQALTVLPEGVVMPTFNVAIDEVNRQMDILYEALQIDADFEILAGFPVVNSRMSATITLP